MWKSRIPARNLTRGLCPQPEVFSKPPDIWMTKLSWNLGDVSREVVDHSRAIVSRGCDEHGKLAMLPINRRA
jgi:hypothetical protein